jgi:hypothetical protein
MLRQGHFLFGEGNKTLVSDSMRKTKNDEALRSRDGIVCFAGPPHKGSCRLQAA